MSPEGPVRVLYCTDTLMAGGVERQLVDLATRLNRSLYSPSVVCLHSQRANLSTHFASSLAEAHIPLYFFDTLWAPADIVRSIGRLIATTWRIRPHILHPMNHHSNHVVRLSRIFLPPATKIIAGINTDYNTRQLWYEFLEQWACDFVVCNSQHMQRKLVKQGHLPSRKVLHIPNGVDLSRFQRKAAINPREQLVPGAQYVIAMIGRISHQKSPHLLAEAIGILKRQGNLPAKFRLVIVGEGESETSQAQLDTVIQQYELAQTVLQLPRTERPEQIYQAAKFTVLATLWEGMPNVALESLAAGRPVIISEAANAAGIIEHEVTGWVVRTGDVVHLAETIRYVFALLPQDLDAIRILCQKRASEFAIERNVESYQELYGRLCATPTP